MRRWARRADVAGMAMDVELTVEEEVKRVLQDALALLAIAQIGASDEAAVSSLRAELRSALKRMEEA